MLCLTPAISALRRLRQGEGEFRSATQEFRGPHRVLSQTTTVTLVWHVRTGSCRCVDVGVEALLFSILVLGTGALSGWPVSLRDAPVFALQCPARTAGFDLGIGDATRVLVLALPAIASPSPRFLAFQRHLHYLTSCLPSMLSACRCSAFCPFEPMVLPFLLVSLSS